MSNKIRDPNMSDASDCMNQYKIFEEGFNIESMSYEDFFFVLTDYIQDCLIHERTRLCISSRVKSIVTSYIDIIRDHLSKKNGPDLLDKLCIENMKNREDANFEESEQVLLKIIQYALFSRERSSLTKDGADFMLGFVFADIGLLGHEYCRSFRLYLEQHTRMHKFKVD